MKSKVTGSNFLKLAFIRASPGHYKGRKQGCLKVFTRTISFSLSSLERRAVRVPHPPPHLNILVFTPRLRCGWWVS